jgi:minor extracellular serine protease Vpr
VVSFQSCQLLFFSNPSILMMIRRDILLALVVATKILDHSYCISEHFQPRRLKFMLKNHLIRKAWAFRILVALLIAFPMMAASANQTDADTGYVVIELSSPGAARYLGGIKGLDATSKKGKRFDPTSNAYAAYRKHLENEQANFRAALGRHASEAEIVDSFLITANAVVVKLNGLSSGQLKKLSGAKSIYASRLYRPNMDASVALINAGPAWAAVGGQADAGDGIRVGVIDSGIVNSLLSGYQPFFNCKDVEFGGIYYSGETGVPRSEIGAANGNNPAPGVAYVSEHGTHVAGTVGGCVYTIDDGSFWDGTVLSGVAPASTLVDYNVFPGIGAGYVAFGGSALSHDIAAAIEDSVANGDDVINMSLGGGVQGPHDFLAEVSNAAVDAGVVVVTSAGNEGPGPYTVGSPGSAANVITVGASTNSRGFGIEVSVPGYPVLQASGGDFPDFDGTPQTLIDWPGSDNLACESDVEDGSLSGEIVLIARGACSFSQKAQSAKLAGAGGAIIFTDDRARGGMAGTDGFDDQIPMVMIDRAPGLAIEADLAGGGSLSPTTVTPPMIVAKTPNELAGFSSRGPAPFTGIVKPDVVAPGVDILSSVFVGFELFNGTSMASPHVAGASAVLLQSNPDWTPAQVKSALATTATDLGLAVWEQGSGLIDLSAAMNTNAFFSPTNASFGSFTGKAPANGSVNIAIDSSESCSVGGTTGSYASAMISGSTLTVDFSGGREAPTEMYGGLVTVDCGTQSHTIPWGAVVDRR